MIRRTQSVAIECDYRPGAARCDSVLMLRASDPEAFNLGRAEVLAFAAARGWGVEDDQFCPKHRATTPEGA